MKTAIISFTKEGAKLCEKLVGFLQKQKDCECDGFVMPRWAQEDGMNIFEGSAVKWTGEAFRKCDAVIFIGAAGIAVRCIAPWVKDKYKDPAVVVIDSAGHFVIPILSGHVGGANALARKLAAYLGAEPVITTATDEKGVFAVDSFAVQNRLFITDRLKAKKISVEVLDGKLIHICCAPSQMPQRAGFSMEQIMTSQVIWTDNPEHAEILISCQSPKPGSKALVLVPEKSIWIGIGCKKGVSADRINDALSEFIGKYSLHEQSIAGFASIDLKKEEEGILDVCNFYQLPFRTYSAAQLMQLKGDFDASDFVMATTGADNVCARAALMAADEAAKEQDPDGYAVLVIPKQKYPGITLAAGYVDCRFRMEQE